MNEGKGAANAIPPEVRAAMESAGATVTTDPETGSTSFGLSGFFLARVEIDPPSVIWGNASFGKFLHELFEYQEWVADFDKTGGQPSLPRKFLPDSDTVEAAGVSVRMTGNSFFGRTSIYVHPALGEFARLPPNFKPMTSSSPKVFMPLRLLVNLDELFTPVAHGSGSSLVYLTPHQTNQYLARLEELKHPGRDSGFNIRTFEVVRAGDHGAREVKVVVDLTEDPDEKPEARWTAYRLVLAAFGTDPDIVSVLMDFDDDYGQRGGRVVTSTAELTRAMADDGAALEAYAKSHRRGFYGDLRHLCEAWEREINHVDRRFRQLVEKEGAIAAARLLLDEPQVSTAFARLAEAGKLELTVEYLVLRPEWAPLFTWEERERARTRLIEHGIEERLVPPFYT